MKCDRSVAYAKIGLPCKADAEPVNVRKRAGNIVRMVLCSAHRRAYRSAIVI